MNNAKVLTDFFFSRMLGKPIIDADGNRIGKVRDMVALWDGATPRITAIKFQPRHQGLLPIGLVASFGDDGLRLAVPFAQAHTKPLRDDELYVARWLLDKQIIDLKGSRLVRVNDITVSIVERDARRTLALVAVDIGVRGLFRRIGLECLVKSFDNHFIGLRHIKPLQDRTASLQLNRDRGKFRRLHPADFADLIEQMDYNSRASFIKSLDCDQAGEAIGEMDLDIQVGIIEQIDSGHASGILEEMPPDEVADILGEMPPAKSRELLSLMAADEAREVRALMDYPAGTAGGLMTSEFVSFPPGLTAGQAIVRLRAMAPGAETIYYLYILDHQGKLSGVMSLRELIIADPDSPLAAVMHKNPVAVRHGDDRRKVAAVFSKYGLLAVPVLDDAGVMLGIVTVDDILQLLLPERSGFYAGLLFRGSKIAARRW